MGKALAYYNDNDPYCAQWLRNLIANGLIAPGNVDERSIVDIQPEDLQGYAQCHFFAGLGGWSYALRLAEWPDDRPVWTGSCPCQPFSNAGKQLGKHDARHLWPEFFRLISKLRPTAVFGEQVAGPAGRAWLDLVSADLENADYATAAANLCAAGVGAPHIRQRLYWVADANSERRDREPVHLQQREPPENSAEATGRGGSGGLGNAHGTGPQERGRRPDIQSGQEVRQATKRSAGLPSIPDFWTPCDWLPSVDGKPRCVEPGTFPLAHGVPARVGKLRAYGNAIVPQVAAAFIAACNL